MTKLINQVGRRQETNRQPNINAFFADSVIAATAAKKSVGIQEMTQKTRNDSARMYMRQKRALSK